MKRLLIFRHAEAEFNSKILDHDRALTPSGNRDSKEVGKYISKTKFMPDLIISSSATRALKTAENAALSGKWNSDFIKKHGIYNGDTQYLQHLLSEQKNTYNTICLVGHEPHFSNLISLLTNTTDRTLDTSSIALLSLNINRWQDVALGSGILTLLFNPKELKLL
tara:strand:+ start:111 stop:605 length:495 start_codon:yes stop_codon:yes gene_type:complete